MSETKIDEAGSELRYFVDHGMIHDRLTGKHVELVEAADMLSVEPDSIQRIAWGIVVKLGAALRNAEDQVTALRTERDALLRTARRCPSCEFSYVHETDDGKCIDDIHQIAVERDEAEQRTAERIAAFLADRGEWVLAAVIRGGLRRGDEAKAGEGGQ